MVNVLWDGCAVKEMVRDNIGKLRIDKVIGGCNEDERGI